MKVTFEFSLPEDQDDYKMYQQAPEFHMALHGMYEWLRSQYKHGAPTIKVEEVWDVFHRTCEVFINDL